MFIVDPCASETHVILALEGLHKLAVSIITPSYSEKKV
jgi:hypothetical protein